MKFGAGFFAITQRNGDFLVLLGKRSQNSTYPGEWCPIGGGSEGDETPLETAKREFEEETLFGGKNGANSKFLDLKLLKIQQKGPKRPLYYLYLCHIPYFLPTPDHENEEIEWIKYEELSSLNPKHFSLKEILSSEDDQDVIERFAKSCFKTK